MKKRKNKYKSVITRRIFKSIKKIGFCVLIVAFVAPMTAMRGTSSWFSDKEKSEGDTFSATSLDGRVSYMELFNITGMVPGSHPGQSLIFSNDGSLDFKYKIKYKNIGGDSELCGALLLTAERNGTKVYDKQLLKDFDSANFSETPFLITASGNDNWDFTIKLSSDAGKELENKTCRFNFDFSAWQINFADNSHGFTDEETEGTNIIRTGSWLNPGDVVINEIIVNPMSDGSAKQPDGENPSVVPAPTEENILSGTETDAPDAETAKNSGEESVPEEKTNVLF